MKTKELLCQLYETSLIELRAIRDLSETYDMLNEQSFINWLDEINKLSLDPIQ